MSGRLSREDIAKRAARELRPGDYCNLGIGLPTLCALYGPEGVHFESENGALAYGPLLTPDQWPAASPDLVDAGSRFFAPAFGMSFFDMLTSFLLIRSGRVVAILGGLQVSANGDLANHSMGAGDEHPIIGGAMDVAWGAKRLIVAMTHLAKDGRPKIVNELTLPLTAAGVVDLVVTDLAVIEIAAAGLVLKEVAPGMTPEEVQSVTEPPLIVSPDLTEIAV